MSISGYPDTSGGGGNSTATYVTKNNESTALPDSFQLQAGTGIALSYGTNSLTVSNPSAFSLPLSQNLTFSSNAYTIGTSAANGPGAIWLPSTGYIAFGSGFAGWSNGSYITLYGAGEQYVSFGQAGVSPDTVEIDFNPGLSGSQGMALDFANQGYNGNPVAGFMFRGAGSHPGVNDPAIKMNHSPPSIEIMVGDFSIDAPIKASHLIGGSASTTISASAGAGTSPSVSIIGTDMAGQITVTTDTVPTASAVICTIAFSGSYDSTPFVQLTPANAAAGALLGQYITATTSGFSMNAGTNPLPGITTLLFNYMVCQ